MTKLDLSWLAGFYEGEGTIGCYKGHKSRPYYSLLCQIAQKDDNILNKLHKQLKFGTYYKQKRTNVGYLAFWVHDAIKFISLIKPYMKVQKKIIQYKKAFRIYSDNVCTQHKYQKGVYHAMDY